jgi:DNA-binding transcriptional ArsR family regulator
MSSGIASLHKILKDETRRKTVLLLNEKGSLSYTQLLDALGIGSTGRLNYHLKVLGELITKNEAGQYLLTEKGKLASRLLQEFKEKKSQSQIEAEFPKGTLVLVCLSSLGFISLLFALYLTGSLDFSRFLLSTFTSISAIVLFVAMEKARKKRALWSPKRQMLGAKIAIMYAGAVGGAVLSFFGGFLLITGLTRMGYFYSSYPFMSASTRDLLDVMIWIVDPVIGMILGGGVGYLGYRRSRFSKNSYYDPYA